MKNFAIKSNRKFFLMLVVILSSFGVLYAEPCYVKITQYARSLMGNYEPVETPLISKSEMLEKSRYNGENVIMKYVFTPTGNRSFWDTNTYAVAIIVPNNIRVTLLSLDGASVSDNEYLSGNLPIVRSWDNQNNYFIIEMRVDKKAADASVEFMLDFSLCKGGDFVPIKMMFKDASHFSSIPKFLDGPEVLWNYEVSFFEKEKNKFSSTNRIFNLMIAD